MNTTQRIVSPGIENIIGQSFDVLDVGFVRVVDYMGSDDSIVQAARVSYGSGTKSKSKDDALIRYLLRNEHTSPFEMCEIKLHIKAPMFVARQWIRHRTANVNEYSARYSVVDKEFYVPNIDSICPQSGTEKQCRSSSILDEPYIKEIQHHIEKHSNNSYNLYSYLLGSSDDLLPGIAREIARMVLTQNYYTQFYWKIDLHNLMNFLRLRIHKHAQKEIREYASCIYEKILIPWVPVAAKAFNDYKINSKTVTKYESDMLSEFIHRKQISKPPEMSDREFIDFLEFFNCNNIEG